MKIGDKVQKTTLPLQYVQEALDYDSTTGTLTWKSRPATHFPDDRVCKMWNTRHSGNVAGCLDKHGHRYLDLTGIRVFAHRVVWLLVSGAWPSGEIDHINGKRDDNRIENLRDVPHADNQRNTKRHKSNTSGVAGVSWAARRNKWQAYISIDGKRVSLGRYTHLCDAISARKSAEVKHGYHANHGRSV